MGHSLQKNSVFSPKSPEFTNMKGRYTPQWQDYELIDSGKFEKLERFGSYFLIRPEPQALWQPSLSPSEWQKMAHARFVQEGSSSGTWEKENQGMPDQWFVNYKSKGLKLRFRLGLTGFKHVGLFPEQAINWNFIYDKCREQKEARVLNLFAYTGGATLAARAAGADVIHCDSIRQVINWGRTNMEESGLDHVRWLLEDAFKFVKREAQRGKTYSGIILDPPAWGHGPKGEKWKLEESIDEMISNVARILHPDHHFLVFNAYSLGFSPIILENLVVSHLGESIRPILECGELCLKERSGRLLPAGVFVRYAK